MFPLHEQPAKVLNHNTRKERHGEDLVLAGDLKLQVVVLAAVLDYFDKQLRPLLFRKRMDGDGAVQAQIGGVQADPEISRRLPQLAPLNWDEKFPGFRLEILKGLGLQDPIVLPARTLSDFVLEPQDGGTVKITFRASGVYESNAISGDLDGLQQLEVDITLDPPKVDAIAQTATLPGIEEPVKQQAVVIVRIDEEEDDAGQVSCTVTFADDRSVTLPTVSHHRVEDELLDELSVMGFAAEFDEDLFPAEEEIES